MTLYGDPNGIHYTYLARSEAGGALCGATPLRVTLNGYT